MEDIRVSLPAPLRNWAEARAAEGGYPSTGDYVGDLVRRDREDEEKLRRLQAAIDEGRASGVSEHDAFAYLGELRARLRASGRSADAA